MRAEAAHFAGAGAFEVPAIAARPQRHLALLAGDIGFEQEIVIARPASGQLADFRAQALAGLQALLIEALAPECVVEERVDVGRGVQVSAKSQGKIRDLASASTPRVLFRECPHDPRNGSSRPT